MWLNTPRRPWEASGTSDMKALVNGGINLSELEDWWAEAYTPEVGWTLGMVRSMSRKPRLRGEFRKAKIGRKECQKKLIPR